MPLHDWSQIPAGLFYDFHQTRSIQIKFNARLTASALEICTGFLSGIAVFDGAFFTGLLGISESSGCEATGKA